MSRDPLADALARKSFLGIKGGVTGKTVALAPGWSAMDVICTSGPRDRRFDERHLGVCVALVLAGSFSYRSEQRGQIMTPGTLLLGNAERSFCCGHEHGEGDRCLSFHFDPAFVEGMAADLGARRSRFTIDRIPPSRHTSALVASAPLLLADLAPCEEFALELLAFALRAGNGSKPPPVAVRHERAISEAARYIASNFHQRLTIAVLAKRAALSPFHFLRVFKATVGATPHQYLMRTRLRASAHRLATTLCSIADIAYDTGFEDLPNFIRSFRREFSQSPSQWRAKHRHNSRAQRE